MAEPPEIMDIITVSGDCLVELPLLASIDRGVTLTKILYTIKSDSPKDGVKLMCATFSNDRFEAALTHLKQNAYLPKDAEICVTGAGYDKFRDRIEEVLKLRSRFIEENSSQVRGGHFLIQNLPINEFCYTNQTISISPKSQSDLCSGLVRDFAESVKDFNSDADSKDLFPSLLLVMGSGAVATLIRKDRSAIFAGGSSVCGKTMLGLGFLILGTSDYDQITQLASAGERRNVDSQAKDLFFISERSPYGIKDPDIPLIPFGKMSEHPYNQNTEDNILRKQDLANSLVNMVVTESFNIITSIIRFQKVQSIFIGGNLTRSPLVRQLIMEKNRDFMMNSLNIRFIKSGHTGAIGAMLSTTEDKNEISFA